MKKKYFLGIDVSKEWIDCCVVDPDGAVCLPYLQHANNYMGMAQMVAQVHKQLDISLNQLVIGFESTGRYSKLLSSFCAEYEYVYHELPGLEVKLSQGIQRGSNDQQAAHQIALYIYMRNTQLSPSRPLSSAVQGLQDLLAYRHRLLKVKHILGVANKELGKVHLSTIDQKLCNKGSVLLQQIEQLIREHQHTIDEHIDEHQNLKINFDLATSVVGIGPVIAAYLIVYTNNFTRFESWRKLACFTGTVPFARSSGKKRGKPANSSIGCKQLKAVLTKGAQAAMQWDPQIKAFAQRKIDQGKAYWQVVNAVKNKLLARVIATVNRGTPYVKLQQA